MRIERVRSALKTRGKRASTRVSTFVQNRPLQSYFAVLALLLLAIIISSFLRKPKEEKKPQISREKVVQTYKIGSVPRMSVQARIEKSGVITITSLTSGVVQFISKREGEHVNKGQTLISLASNYQGGNSLSLQRQIAQTQYNNVKDTYPTQKEVIAKQRDLANQTDANNDQLRDITSKSIDETKNLISLNNDIISSLDQQIKTLQANPPSFSNDQLIIGAKQAKSQFVAANNAANNALRGAEYQSSSSNPPAQLSDTQKDIALKQLDIQEKMLELSLTVSRIQAQIAQVNEATMFPAAPFSGTIQRVLVKEGQAVTPGTKLLIFQQNVEEDPITAIALVPLDIAQKVSLTDESYIYLNDKLSFSESPAFVSQEAIEGNLYGVYFPVPDIYSKYITDNGSVRIELSVGQENTTAAPFIPVDAVYQTRQDSYVFVVEKGKAKNKKVSLGNVFGAFVEIEGGISEGDTVILDRNVIEGDSVKVN